MSDEPDLSWHKRWLALDDHRLRLLDAWCERQRRMESQVGWFGLSDAARAEVERINGLLDLDATLALIHRRLRRWLRTHPAGPADDVEIVIANLRVAERLLPAEENRVVHHLIAHAVRDLMRMQDPS